MKYFDKYNSKVATAKGLKEEYERYCAETKGNGLYRFENLEDASSFIVVHNNKSYMVEKYFNDESYIGLATRISYDNGESFYSVGENIFLKPQPENENQLEPIKSYEGFVFSNGQEVELTQINARYIYQTCKDAIENACFDQVAVAAEQ